MHLTETVTLRVPSRTYYLNLVRASSREICLGIDGLAMSDQTVYDIQLAVNEAVANTMQHAYEGRSDGEVEVVFRVDPGSLIIDVVDWGQTFDISVVPDPDLSEPQMHGYGLFLMRQLMDNVSYDTDPTRGNRMRLVKRLDGGHER